MIHELFDKVRDVLRRPQVTQGNQEWVDDAVLQTVRSEGKKPGTEWLFAWDLDELYKHLAVYRKRHGRSGPDITMEKRTAAEILAHLQGACHSGIEEVPMRLYIDGRTVGLNWHNSPLENYFAFTTRYGREIARFHCQQDEPVSFKPVYAAIARQPFDHIPRRLSA